MAWSFRLFDVAGTAVRIHFTFFLLLAWIGAAQWMRGGPAEAIDGVLFIVILFLCVLLHEFGHVFAAPVCSPAPISLSAVAPVTIAEPVVVMRTVKMAISDANRNAGFAAVDADAAPGPA